MANEYTVNASDLTSVADAIRTKGGTSAQLEFPSGFVSAIQAIKSGVTVQKNSGSFTTGTNGSATVNCGFRPDMVYIKGDTDDGYNNSQAMAFDAESRTGNLNTAMWASDGAVDIVWTRSSTGFSVTVTLYDWDWNGTAASRKTYNYVAVKYT